MTPASPPVSALVEPAKSRYRTIVLVSDPRHFQATEGDALFIATEWLTLHLAKEQGIDAIHPDWAVPVWPSTLGPAEDVYVRACEWALAEGRDLTEYRGVSLGTMYATFLACSWQEIARLDVALREIISRLDVKRIVLRDISSQFYSMNSWAKKAIVAQIARELNIDFDDQLDEAPANTKCFHYRSLAPSLPRPRARDHLRNIFAAIIEFVFRVRLAGRRSGRRVFLFISNLSLRQMVQRSPGRSLVPVIPFSASPKTWKFLSACWRNGILPAALLPAGDPRTRAQACAAIIDSVEAHWRRQTPTTSIEQAHREVVRSFVLRNDVLNGLAAQVDCFAHLIDRLGIRRVVSGDASAPVGRALCELARAKGLGADESLNGVFIGPLRDPIRMRTGNRDSAVTHELALGPAVERWLSISRTPLPSTITGYPGLGIIEPGALSPPRRRRALILPIYAWINDPGANRSNLSPPVIELIRGLDAMGFEGIRLKIHPGVDSLPYYRALVEHFSLPCIVDQSGAFLDHLAWADVVVGPPGSGTFLETLAAGKPYYVLRPRPTSIPDELLEGAVVGADAAEICAAIAEGRVPDREAVLARWAAFGQVDDPPARIWEAIAANMGGPQH